MKALSLLHGNPGQTALKKTITWFGSSLHSPRKISTNYQPYRARSRSLCPHFHSLSRTVFSFHTLLMLSLREISSEVILCLNSVRGWASVYIIIFKEFPQSTTLLFLIGLLHIQADQTCSSLQTDLIVPNAWLSKSFFFSSSKPILNGRCSTGDMYLKFSQPAFSYRWANVP